MCVSCLVLCVCVCCVCVCLVCSVCVCVSAISRKQRRQGCTRREKRLRSLTVRPWTTHLVRYCIACPQGLLGGTGSPRVAYNYLRHEAKTKSEEEGRAPFLVIFGGAGTTISFMAKCRCAPKGQSCHLAVEKPACERVRWHFHICRYSDGDAR